MTTTHLEPQTVGTAKKRILLVEDDLSILKMTKIRLEHEGFAVIVATDGDAALTHMERSLPVDLILLDVNLPKRNGLEVCRLLKASSSTVRIPIILLTGSAGKWARLTDECIDLGVAGWLKKPFRSQELLEKVYQALGDKRAAHRESKPRILLVDDEPSIVKMVGKRLEVEGFEVLVATDGQEALTKARTETPHLMILDAMLPKLTGYEVCMRLKQDPSSQHIPIVLFTAKAQEKDEQLGRACGADAYVRKPFNAHELLTQIRILIQVPQSTSEASHALQ